MKPSHEKSKLQAQAQNGTKDSKKNPKDGSKPNVNGGSSTSSSLIETTPEVLNSTNLLKHNILQENLHHTNAPSNNSSPQQSSTFSPSSFITGSNTVGTDASMNQIYECHPKPIYALTISNDILVTASVDKTIKTFEAKNGQLIHTLKGHSHTVSCLKVIMFNNEVLFIFSLILF